jgi:hypothetical protein
VVNWWLARLFWDAVATGNARINTNGPSRERLFHMYLGRAVGQPIISVGPLDSREDGGTASNRRSVCGSPHSTRDIGSRGVLYLGILDNNIINIFTARHAAHLRLFPRTIYLRSQPPRPALNAPGYCTSSSSHFLTYYKQGSFFLSPQKLRSYPLICKLHGSYSMPLQLTTLQPAIWTGFDES